MLLANSAQQTVYLMSLSAFNRGIWQDPGLCRISIARRRGGYTPVRDAYIWDLYTLSEYMPAADDGSRYRSPGTDDLNWLPVLTGEYRHNEARDIFASVESSYTVQSFNQPKASGYSASGALNVFPEIALLDDNLNRNVTLPSLDAENQVYLLTTYPSMPFLVASSLPGSSYGPLFPTHIGYEVNGVGSLSPVRISVEYSGGRAVRCDQMPIYPPNQITNAMSRSATLIDCGFDTNLYTSITELQAGMSANRDWPAEHLVGMSLDVKQDVSFGFPVPSAGRTDEHGPRFAYVSSRQVTGSIRFYSVTEEPDLEGLSKGTGSVTMYFGGGFFFPIQNVEWMRPTVTATAPQGYIHEYHFLARAADSAVSKPFNDAGLPASEFVVSNYD